LGACTSRSSAPSVAFALMEGARHCRLDYGRIDGSSLRVKSRRRGLALTAVRDLRGCLKTVRFGRVAWSWS